MTKLTHATLINQKELENEIHQMAINQIKKCELKAKQKMYASSTKFGRHIVSQCTLEFADEIRNKIENTCRVRAIKKETLLRLCP